MNVGILTGQPVAVLGAGTMGAGIAQLAAANGHEVRLFDPDASALDAGIVRIGALLKRAEEKGRLAAGEAAAAAGRVRPVNTPAEAARLAALVIEAAPERLEVKRELFEEVAAAAPSSCVLATNTSTLSVSAIMRDIPGPERTCGIHFFNPAPVMRLVEVVRGYKTSAQVLSAVEDLVLAWGKSPIVVADTPGFIVNRVARPFYGEALRLLGDNIADVTLIDRLSRDAGFPMGPFELMDLIGIDVNFEAALSVFNGYFQDSRFRPHPIQRKMVETGRLGRKTGIGYYTYESESLTS